MKRLFFILYALTCTGLLFAQRDISYVYSAEDYTTDTLRMDDYTYISDTLKHTRVTLRNITDHAGRGDISYADGTPLEADLATSLQMETVVLSDGTGAHLLNIVDDAFTKEQVESLNGRNLHIVLNISSSSGEVTDVYFNYVVFEGYANIPIDVYRNMELRFKNEICFDVTELGSKLNYCLLSWLQCPKGREGDGLTMPENGQLTLPSDKLKNPIGGTIVTP